MPHKTMHAHDARFLNFSQPWLIEGQALRHLWRACRDVWQSDQFTPQNLMTQPQSRASEETRYTLRDGVATLKIDGPILRNGGFWADYFGYASTESLAREFEQAMNNRDVKALIFNIASPGGEAGGIAEFAEQIYQRRDEKPIIAYGDGSVCSAAYWIASACDEIVLNQSSAAGCIGTVMSFLDDSKWMEKLGLEEIEFVSSQTKNKNPHPKSKAGQSQYQQHVDDLTEIFGEAIARNRGVSVETVFSDYGAGAFMVGNRALHAGLVDRLGDYESLHAETVAMVATENPIRAQVRAITKTATGINATIGVDMSRQNPVQTAEEAVVEQVAVEEANAQQQAVITAQVELQARAEALQAQLDAANSELETRRTNEAAQARAAFATAMESKVPPAARDQLSALFASAQTGEATVEQLQQFITELPPHSAMTGIPADTARAQEIEGATQEAQAPVTDTAKAAAEQKERMLKSTGTGRAALQEG